MFRQGHFPGFTFRLTDGSQYYGFPSIDGAGLKVGRHDGGLQIDPDEPLPEFGTVPGDGEELTAFLRQYIHEAAQELDYGRSCKYTLTPDEDFVIDIHPQYPYVAIAAGFSGPQEGHFFRVHPYESQFIG